MSVPVYTGTVPSRSQTQVDFDENVQDMLDFIGGTEEDDFIPALNSAVSGLASTEVVLASAHFIGPWSSQTGAHDVPTSVSHDDKYWMLLSDTLDITTIEPGASADWQEIRTTGELPRISEYITGNMQGLEYSYNSADTINIKKGNCYDSTGTTILTLLADTTATISSPAINTIYNVFVTNEGDIQFDTDVDGATLLAGAVTALRWIGFVLTDASGNIIMFNFTKETITFNKASETPINMATVPPSGCNTAIDLSSFIPTNRSSGVLIGGRADGECVICLGYDGVNVFSSQGYTSTYASDSDIASWAFASGGGIRLGVDRRFIPLDGDNIYWGQGTRGLLSSVTLSLQQVAIMR